MPINMKALSVSAVAHVVEAVPNPEGLKTMLVAVKAAKELATWSEAHKAAGYEGSFQNRRCEAITTAARNALEGGDALICAGDGSFGAKVVEKHLATLAGFGYDAAFLAVIKQKSATAAAANGLAKAVKKGLDIQALLASLKL